MEVVCCVLDCVFFWGGLFRILGHFVRRISGFSVAGFVEIGSVRERAST